MSGSSSLPLVREQPRRPSRVQLEALSAVERLGSEAVGPALVLFELDAGGTPVGMSSLFEGVLPPRLAACPLWAVVERAAPSGAPGLWIRIGGPDVVFTFRVGASGVGAGGRVLEGVAPSPFRRSPTRVDLERAHAVSTAVFRAGGMLRLDESTGEWTAFVEEEGDSTPIARAFSAICHPACALNEYSAACLTPEGSALIEIGREDHLFAFTRGAVDAELVWHGVLLRTKAPA